VIPQVTTLFSPRPVTSSLELATLGSTLPGGKPLERVYLLASPGQGRDLAKQHDIESDKYGAFFSLDSGVDLRLFAAELLPYFARPAMAPFLTDLAPANSFGASVATLLLSSSVDPVAGAAARRYGHKCYFCGAPRTDQNSAHPARAWWRYYEPSNGETFGRQHLVALTPMCTDCSDMLQLGRGKDGDRAASALARLTKSFRFAPEEAKDYVDLVHSRLAHHSAYFWAADVSRVFGESRVTVQAAWSHRGEPGIDYPVLHRPGTPSRQPASLVLCGVRYTLGDTDTEFFNR